MTAEYSDFAKKLLRMASQRSQSGGGFIINEMKHELEIRIGSERLATQDAREKAAWKDDLKTLESDGLILQIPQGRLMTTPSGAELPELRNLLRIDPSKYRRGPVDRMFDIIREAAKLRLKRFIYGHLYELTKLGFEEADKLNG